MNNKIQKCFPGLGLFTTIVMSVLVALFLMSSKANAETISYDGTNHGLSSVGVVGSAIALIVVLDTITVDDYWETFEWTPKEGKWYPPSESY